MFEYPKPPFRFSVFSTKAHAVWDYLIGVVFIGLPFLLGFADDGRAQWPMVMAGVLVLLLATVTDYEGGLFRRVLMTLHLGLDRLIGSLLGASPWLLGFSDRVYLPHLILGLLILTLGLLTRLIPPIEKQCVRYETCLINR